MTLEPLTPAQLDDPVDEAFEQALEQVRLWTEYSEFTTQ